MNRNDFNETVEDRIRLIKKVLQNKGKEYASDENVFHNFIQAKGISFHNSQEKIAWEYSVKHLQSIKDLIDQVDKGAIPSIALVEEKFGDAINYLILIEAMIKERIINFTFKPNASC